jgi:photosystem II stability/assembly factor-like uncharacterized protein
MKSHLIVLTFLFFVFVGASSSFAQWTQTNGPFGGKVTAILAADSILYSTNYTCIFRSTDNGDHWSQLTTDLHGFYNINSFARIGSTIYAGCNDGGVFRSTNHGDTWTLSNTGLPVSSVTSITAVGTNLYAAKWGTGVFISTDGGNQWRAITSGLSTTSIGFFKSNEKGIFAISDQGPFFSDDNGSHWIPANSGLPSSAGNMFSFCTQDTVLYYSIDGTGIFRSDNNGSRWIKIDSSQLLRHTHSLFAFHGRLFAGTYTDGLFISTNSGNSWTLANTPIADSRIFCYTLNGRYLLAGSEGSGVFRSTDDGINWIRINQGLHLNVSCVTINKGNLYAGTLGGGLFITTDNGATWTDLSLRTCYDFINSLVVTDTTIIVSNGGSNGNGPDGGVSISKDNGMSWTSISQNLPNPNVWGLAIFGGNLFAATEGAGIFRSTNNGASWSQASSGIPEDTIWSLVSNGQKLYAGTQNGLFFTSDTGAHWTKIHYQVNSGWMFKCIGSLAIHGDTLFAVTDQGNYYSMDDGLTWTFLPGQSKLTIQGMAATSDYLFAGTPKSVWKISMSVATGVRTSGPVYPPDFRLEQNYPNPFNPATNISFNIPSKSFVTLKVFDLLGREVSILINEELSAGVYTHLWIAANISSGIYFYRLSAVPSAQRDLVPANGRTGQAGVYTETKKLVLLR